MALEVTVKSSVLASLTSAPDLTSLIAKVSAGKSVAFTDGAGAGQANVIFADTRTLSASANESLDFSGSLTQPNGSAAVFARIKYIYVEAATGNTNNVQVTQPASNGVPGIFLAASDGVAIKPGGNFEWMSPDASGAVVTASTGDLINIANSGGTTGVTYNIVVVGAAT
jgi:hypothetical protein